MPANTTPDPVAIAIEVTENLTRMLQTENDLLRAHRAKDVSALVPEKGRLGQQLRQAMEGLRHNRHMLETASPSMRERLEQAAGQFHGALGENGRLLGTLKKIAEGLVQAVAAEAMRQAQPLKNYGNTGQMAFRSSGPATMSLNQLI